MIDYDESGCLISLLTKFKGSVIPRALLFAVPTAVLAALLVVVDSEDLAADLSGDLGMFEIRGSQVYTASTAAIIVLLGFRTRQAMSRFWEGTSLLHQMRGEWFDSVSCLITFSRGAADAKPLEVVEFRHTLVRLMSLCHGSALEEIKEDGSDHFEVIDIKGLDQRTLLYLDECKKDHGFNRVEVLLHMIQVLITQNLDDGVLKIAPPILSRVYQTLSRGLVNLLNATKIKNTRFPFPYAQLIAVFMLLHTVWTPFMIAALVREPWWAALIAFLPVFGMFSLNFVASQLEMPFGQDDNDLPLAHFQHEMNRGLLMLLHPGSDMLAKTSKFCIRDYEELQNSVGTVTGSEVATHISDASAGIRSRTSMFVTAARLSEENEKKSEEEEVEEGDKEAGNDVEDVGEGGEVCEEGESLRIPPVAKSVHYPVQLPDPATGACKTDAPVPALPGASVAASVSPPDLLPLRSHADMHAPPEELEITMQRWMRRTDDQLEALRANTQVISRFTDALPHLLGALGRPGPEAVSIEAAIPSGDDHAQPAVNIFALPLTCNSCAEERGTVVRGRRPP